MERLDSHSNLRLDLDSTKQQESILGLLEGRIDKVDHNLIYVRSDVNDPSINGHQAFTQFSQTSAYRELASKTEGELIQRNATAINQSTRKTKEIVELGPGNNKFVQYADVCLISKDIAYVGADMSMSSLTQADTQAKNAGYRIANRIANDWLQPGVFDKVNQGSYWCFGGSVGNIGITKLLKSLKSSSYTSASTATMTYFVAPDPSDVDYDIQVQKLRAMYGASDTPFSDTETVQKASTMILKPFEALGLDVSCLELDVQRKDAFGRAPAKIILGAKVTKDFSMQVGGRVIHKKSGDFMPLIESKRYTKKQCEQEIEDANCKLMCNDSKDGMGLMVVKLNPRK